MVRRTLGGGWNDLEIFQASFASQLDPFEPVEADNGYIGEAALKVKCPACITIPGNKKTMMNRVQARQKTIDKRFKQ